MSTPANQIPAFPGVAAPAAAAPSPPVASLNTTIPPHPAVAAAMRAAQGQAQPAAPQQLGEDFGGDGGDVHPQASWFEAVATGRSTEGLEPQAPQAPVPPQQGRPQQSVEDPLAGIDALLQDLPTGEPPVVVPQAQPQQFQQPQQQQIPQNQQVPQQPQQQQPVQPQQPPQAQPQTPPVDAAAAQERLIDHLMGRDYAISEADQRRLIAEPEAVLPRLAARVHVNTMRDVGQQLAQALPAIINHLVEQKLSAQKHETEFFRRFPQLSDPRFRETVETSLAHVKATTPNITQDQLYHDGATLAAFRIRASMRRQAPQQQQAPALPPAMHAPQMRVPASPFVPMSPGSGGVPAAGAAPMNEFDRLSREVDLFDTW